MTRLFVGLVLLAACGDESEASWVAPDWLGDAPVTEVAVHIGDGCVAPGPPVERIASERLSRIGNARFLSSSSIAVADALEDAVLIFEGDSVRTLGGPGEGPREFGAIGGLAVRGDTLFAWDGDRRRVVTFSAAGQFLGALPLSPEHTRAVPGFSAPTRAGAFAFIPRVWTMPSREGRYRDTVTAVLVGPGPSDAIEGVRVPGLRQFAAPAGRGWRMMPGIFSPDVLITTADGHAWIGESESGVLTRLDEAGRPSTAVHLRVDRGVPGTDEIEEWRAAIRGSAPEGSVLAAIADAIPAADSLPAFERLRGTTGGSLWVGEYILPGTPSRRHWVFDAAGEYRACVTLPAESEVEDAAFGLALVQVRDAFGVPSLEVVDVGGAR